MILWPFTHNNNIIVISVLLFFLFFLFFLLFLIFSLGLFLFCILPRVFILRLSVLPSLDLFLLQTLQTSDKILNRKVDNMVKTSNVMFLPDPPYAVLLPQQLLKLPKHGAVVACIVTGNTHQLLAYPKLCQYFVEYRAKVLSGVSTFDPLEV